jgi:hypothetical protein
MTRLPNYQITQCRIGLVPFLDIVASSGLGSLVGMRHALEPDHLAAVSTVVSYERSSARAAWLGFCWGLGHTLALVTAGAVLLLMRAEMPASLVILFELMVAAMLIGLGVRTIAQAVRSGPAGPAHVHRHGRLLHRHAAVPAHLHIGDWTVARRPLIIGALHGLAGSGTLTALVLTTLPTAAAQLSYVLLFGLGSTLGMAALSGLLGWPLARVTTHHSVARGVSILVGAVSAGVGVAWGYPLIREVIKMN